MKKLYTFLSVLILLCSMSTRLQAQSCSTAKAFPYKYVIENKCYLYVTDGIPNANINVYNNVTRINLSEKKTDSTGQGTVFIDCAQSVTDVILTRADGTVCSVKRIADVSEIKILPIILSSFKAEVKSSATELQWVSTLELESKQFVIQRSTDGKNYSDIGTVVAKGSSVGDAKYNYSDAQAVNSAAYYRLKMVDVDGSFEYSKVVYVNSKKGTSNTTLSVFPNPFRADVQLVGIAASDVNKQNIRVYDVTGKQVNFLITGSNAISIDANAPRGVYILRVKEQSFKLVKQ